MTNNHKKEPDMEHEIVTLLKAIVRSAETMKITKGELLNMVAYLWDNPDL